MLPVNSSLSVTLSQDEVSEEGRGGKELEKERRGVFQDRREEGRREGGREGEITYTRFLIPAVASDDNSFRE